MRKRFELMGVLTLAGTLLGTAPCGGGSTSPAFPLVLVADVDLPGKAARFDYEDLDATRGHDDARSASAATSPSRCAVIREDLDGLPGASQGKRINVR